MGGDVLGIRWRALEFLACLVQLAVVSSGPVQMFSIAKSVRPLALGLAGISPPLNRLEKFEETYA